MAFRVHLRSDPGKLKMDPTQAKTEVLTELLELCAHCKSQLPGHEYAWLASWPVKKEKDEALLKFFEAIKDHDWVKLREFQSWLGATDDVEAYAVRCAGQDISVVVIKTHFELFQPPARLLYSESLPPQEANKLIHAFTDLQWRMF